MVLPQESSVINEDHIHQLIDECDLLFEKILLAASELTDRGSKIDDFQVLTEDIAYIATQIRAVKEMKLFNQRMLAANQDNVQNVEMTSFYLAVVLKAMRDFVTNHLQILKLNASDFSRIMGNDFYSAYSGLTSEQRIRSLGKKIIDSRGINNINLEDEVATLTREMARDFAAKEVKPIAQEIHRNDLLVPDDLINKFSEQGFFGSSIPEEYGGTGMGDLSMVIITEELSAASLAAAGSLATRPEILSKALLAGGTDEQKKEWLPKIARGETLVAIAVTEPDTGSDVSSLQTKAEPSNLNGIKGWKINGSKAWSTFSGRANVLALLARTDEDIAKGAKGLSLFIVPKDSFNGHTWEYKQKSGGSIQGTANPTPGYRGMHSYTLAIEDFWVPHTNLVGEDSGINKGFYLQMGGFAVGRLQTGGRAIGVAQAALEKACNYVSDRSQFKNKLSEYQLTQYKIGSMATSIAAGRHLTYAAAKTFHTRSIEAAMCKLLTCDIAGEVTREALLLHGGWGFSEEDPISRYTIDALVLPIFEGVKPILELKVIGRELLSKK
ncbi:MAG: (2S)-methylsuccinyl-CoA dehydrogenase [Chloroflexi bacterium]|jgi:(2S)-methylsuccinyl-CoA dehydrogenase|nr:MAG: (2S)-methylsuccinyl-CoA dehydrogenase [Chloroflexota bacterium]